MKQLLAKTGVEKITYLLLILQELTKQKSRPLASFYFEPIKGKENENRVNEVCQFVQKTLQITSAFTKPQHTFIYHRALL